MLMVRFVPYDLYPHKAARMGMMPAPSCAHALNGTETLNERPHHWGGLFLPYFIQVLPPEAGGAYGSAFRL